MFARGSQRLCHDQQRKSNESNTGNGYDGDGGVIGKGTALAVPLAARVIGHRPEMVE